jgi:ceramide glucosyltransferase
MAIFWVFAGITAFGLAVYMLQLYAVRSAMKPLLQKRRSEGVAPFEPPPVSILKPLRGLDDNLFDNLESFCFQDYPEYEIIFALQDHNDPACKVVNKIKDKHPDKNISIIIERYSGGLNPKVNNLITASRAARYDTVLISDSNVTVGKDYLAEIVRHLQDPDVGLVTNLIRGVGGRTLGSLFENLHLNSFIIGSVCFLDRYLNMPCVVGKSMLMRKKDLAAIGGFAAVKDVLAEDYLIGREMHRAGKRVVVSSYLIDNVNQDWSIKRFLNRHTRWGKLRWKIGGVRYVSELLGNQVVMALLPLLLLGPSRETIGLASIAGLLKILGDRYLGRITGADANPLHYFLVPVKDLIIGLVWFVPLLSTTVVWRGNRYLIAKDSRLSPVPASGVWSWRHRLTNVIMERFA